MVATELNWDARSVGRMGGFGGDVAGCLGVRASPDCCAVSGAASRAARGAADLSHRANLSDSNRRFDGRIPVTPAPPGGISEEDKEFVLTHRPIFSEEGDASVVHGALQRTQSGEWAGVRR